MKKFKKTNKPIFWNEGRLRIPNRGTLACGKHSFIIYLRTKIKFIKSLHKSIKPLNMFMEKSYSILIYIQVVFIPLVER